MPRATAIQTNFTAGEITPRLYPRVDIQKFRNAAGIVENFVIKPHGGAWKRPGTMYVAEAREQSSTSILVPFEFNLEQAYVLEFGDGYIRVFKDRGITLASSTAITNATQSLPCTITAAGHGIANGERVIIDGVGGMTELNDRWFTASGVTTDTLELSGIDSSAFAAYTTGGTVYRPVEIATTYTAAELADLQFAQSADTLYIAHQAHPLAKLTRTSHTDWTLTDVDITSGPFRPINSDDNNVLTFSITGGAALVGITNGTGVSDPAIFTTADPHTFEPGEAVVFSGIAGSTAIANAMNGKRFLVYETPTTTTFSVKDEITETPGWFPSGTYTSGGTIVRSQSRWRTLFPGTRVTMTARKPTFTADNVGALWRVWERGQSARVSSPLTGSRVRESQLITNAGKVYGLANVSTSESPSTWQPDWLLPTHTRGVVEINDGFSTSGGDRVDCKYLHSLYGVLRIVEYVSETEVVCRVVKDHLPRSAWLGGSSFWEEGAWSPRRGYPSAVTFFEQRLWAAGSLADPQTVWSSVSAAFEDFTDGTEDDSALNYAIASERVEVIRWLAAGRTLALGTASAEYVINSTGNDSGLTPKNVRVARQTSFGSGQPYPVAVGSTLIFAQRATYAGSPARKLRELVYSFERDAYVAPELSILAEHITGTGLVQLAYQAAPDSIIWGVRADGALIGLTYEREQEVIAWHRQWIGGGGLVERIAVIPGADGDELWMIVNRAGYRTIEYLSTGLIDSGTKEASVYLDSAATYSGSSTDTISGLWHLEGETVDVLNNGAHEAAKTVTGGRITLDRSTTLAHVGLPYTSVLESLDVEAGAAMGTAQARSKRISEVYLRLHRSLGGTVGPDATRQDPLLYRVPGDVMDSSPPLYSGYVRVELPSGWDKEAKIHVRHDEPFPLHILAAVAEINTSG